MLKWQVTKCFVGNKISLIFKTAESSVFGAACKAIQLWASAIQIGRSNKKFLSRRENILLEYIYLMIWKNNGNFKTVEFS